MSYPEFLIDKRVIERNLKKGIVEQKELEKLLSRLPDVQDNAEACQTDVDDDEGDDEEEE